MKDKIIGPLTMAQFLYLLVAFLVDYVLLQTLFNTHPIIFLLIGVPIALFAMAMAFLKINDIPFPKFFQAAVLFILAPKTRVWHKAVDVESPIKIEAQKAQSVNKVVRTHVEKSEIEKLASVLDTAGWAAVRDQHLEDFVKGFGASHHHVVKVLAGSNGTKTQAASQAPAKKAA